MRPIETPHGPVPSHVVEAVSCALRLDPGQRPNSAAEFATLLTGAA
jgi:hypothetical protein